jgi:ASC-1-like (ASCH) protein
MGTDEVALFRGNVYSSLKKHKFDVEAASKELSKKSAKDIKKILGAFKDTIDVEKDDRYPKKQDGTVAFGKKKQIARALAEDLLKDFGKFSGGEKSKKTSGVSGLIKVKETPENKLKGLSHPTGRSDLFEKGYVWVKPQEETIKVKQYTPDTNVKEESTEPIDRVALHKERMRSKGQDIVNENNPLREITKEFGEQSGLAYVAAASASRNSFLNNLSKMGYSDEQIGSIKKEIGDIDAFQKRAKNVKTSTSVRVSRIYRDLSSRLISNIDAMISPKVNAYINRLGASEVEWKVVAPMFDESYKSFLETQDSLGVTSPEDRETAFEIFVKGMRKGIGASTYSNKKDIRKMFTQWALNHPLGIGRPEIFHYRVVHKARRMLEKIFGVTNVMWDESIKRGSNMMKTFELEDREGLDVIEEDIKDDIVDGREMDEENLHILSSNIKRMVETATGKDIFSDDMINIQDASIDSANLGDFVDFLMKEYGISEKALLDKKISNLITRYHNTMKNRIPSSAKKFFVLSNLTPENELDTDFNFSYHLRLKKQDWKTRRTLPGYAPKNFLDERGLGERTAYLYASDVMQVFKLKKSHGELVNEETGEVYQDKLYAKENTSRITRKKLNQINDELGLRYVELGSERPMFIVGMKHGGSRALVIGDATDDDISIGTSEEAIETFLADEIANKRMTEEQAQNMRNYAEAWIDSNENVWIQIIGRHNYLKEAFHNKYLMKDIDGTPNKNHIQWMFNRMRLIFSEGSVAYGMGDSKIMIIDPSNTTITYKGKVLESWADYLKEGIFRYGFDGALFTSHKNFIKKQGLIGSDFIEKGGVFGWLKTVLSDRKDNGDSFLGVKALEMLAPDGMEWTDGDGNLIARSMLDENGMVQIVDKNGNYIDQLLSTEESKIGHAGVGYYNQLNTPLTIPETATRILQTPSEMSKNSSASPFQWLDMMLDPELLEPGNKNYNEEASNAYKILTKHTIDIANVYLKQLGHMSKYPATVGAYLKRLTNKKTLSETELNKWLNALDGPELAFMAHNFFVDQYEPMIKNRMIVNGAYKGRKLNHSSYLHIRPNFAEDLDEWESAPSMSDRVSWNKMEKKLLATLSSQEKKDYKAIKRDDYKVDFMNEWLATDPLEEWEYWTLDFRMPVNSIIAPQMFRNDKFKYRRTGDTAQYHLMSILKNFFADFDGDTVSKKWMNKEETEVLLKFTRKQNEDGSWSQSDVYESLMNYPKLDLFEPPEHKDLSDFGGMLDAMTDGYKNAWAMGLVMNVKALRGVMQTKSFQLHLKNTLKNHANQGRDYQIDVIKSSEMVLLPWKLKDTTDESHLNPGEEIVVDESGNKLLRTTSRNALDLIMQAAVDDVKYGLLAEWGFDGVPFMMNMIFKKTYKDTGEVAESLDDYGNRNYDSYYLWKLLTKQPSAQFAFSRSRAGLDKNRQNQSMRQIMFQSKDISRQKNLTDKELRGIMKAYGVRADLQKGYSPKMMDIIIHNKPTHYEMLLSRPFEYFKKTFGTDDDEAFMSFLRSDPNVQANAHRLTMEQLTGRPSQGEDAPKVEGKIDTWRLPKKDGGIFQEGITAEQEAEGYAFFRVLAKDFYRILDAGKVIRQKVIRDVSFSIAAYDHQEEFRDLENKYKPEFDKLSPQAQFVSTIWFLQGASGDYTKLPPGTVKAQADNAMEANRLLDLIKDYDVMLAAYRKEYRETRKKIESGEITDVVAKPTKAGRMDFEYDGDQAEGIKSANAFDAVKSGEKTATTRYKKTKFWEDLEIGDTVEFSNKSKEKVLVRVTESPREIDFANMSKEELKRWSELEGWSLEYAESNAKNKRKGIQFQFALIDTEPVPGDVNARGVRRIISGAQTGADQGALEAARDDLGIETGGHMTSDHMTKDGPRPDFEKTYGMQTTKSTKYPPRSKKNIDSADASIAFRLKPSLGTDKSIGYARTGIWQKVLSASKDDGHSPVLVLNNAENTRRNRKKIRDFIDRNEPRVLNIIGNSEQKSPGLQKAVRALLNDALREDPTRFRPMTNRLDRIKKEALRTQKRKDETEGKVQALKDTMEELNDIKGKKHVQQKRYIEKLLPSDLWSEEARHIYVDEFNKQLKVATDEKPQSAFLVSYQEFDRILNQHLVRNGTC